MKTGRGLMVIRLKALRYGQMVALFGSPSARKQWGNMSVGSGSTEKFSYPVTMSKVLFATTNAISGENGYMNNRVVRPSSSECYVYNGASNHTSNMLILLLGLA